jgi:hypothetical protein
VKAESFDGVAAKLTTEPDANTLEQDVGQLTPLGKLVTEPVPAPARVTVRANPGTNVAPTAVSEFTVNVQGLVPTHPDPLHPANVEPWAAVADRVTVEPALNGAEHDDPQLIPVGLLPIVPEPLPRRVTETVYCVLDRKLAITD